MQFSDGAALLAGLAAFGITYLLMPSVARIGRRRDLADSSNDEPSLQGDSKPRSGGIAIWFGIFGGILVAAFVVSGLPGGFQQTLSIPLSTALAVLAGASVAALAGFYDDMKPMDPRAKLAAQVAAALPLLLSSEFVGTIQALLGGSTLAGFAAFPVIVLWVVFLMNAINLVDGLDGLAGGLVVISATFIVILGGLQGGALLLALALVGSILGFLRFNLPPAKVFMGDTGSLLVGYVVAVLAMLAVETEPTGRRAMATLVVLGLPGLDALMAIVRRGALGRTTFHADADHIHHRMLIRSGGVPARAISSLYLVAMTLGVFGLLTSLAAPELTGWAFSIVVALAMILLWDLRYFDIDSYSDPASRPIPRKRESRLRQSGASDAPPKRASRVAARRTERTP